MQEAAKPGPDSQRTSLTGEASGACGDLGTLLAHGLGAMTIVGLAPAGVLFGFGAFLISAGFFYGLPMAVQPMKAVSAVMLTDRLSPGEVAARAFFWAHYSSSSARRERSDISRG